MTKLQAEYDLWRPLEDADAEGVARAHSVYGIMRVHVAPTLDRVIVDYDATRLSELEVEAVLRRTGLPVKAIVSEYVGTRP